MATGQRGSEVSGPDRQAKSLGGGRRVAEGVTRVKWADVPSYPPARFQRNQIRSPIGSSQFPTLFFPFLTTFSTRLEPPSSRSPPLHEVSVLPRSSCRPPGPLSPLLAALRPPRTIPVSPTFPPHGPVTSHAFDRTRPTRLLPFSGHAPPARPPHPSRRFAPFASLSGPLC